MRRDIIIVIEQLLKVLEDDPKNHKILSDEAPSIINSQIFAAPETNIAWRRLQRFLEVEFWNHSKVEELVKIFNRE